LAGDADYVPSYYLVNVRIQWLSANEDWRANVYVNNLTDEVILSNPFVSDDVQTFGTYLAPRNYGLTLTYSF